MLGTPHSVVNSEKSMELVCNQSKGKSDNRVVALICKWLLWSVRKPVGGISSARHQFVVLECRLHL